MVFLVRLPIQFLSGRAPIRILLLCYQFEVEFTSRPAEYLYAQRIGTIGAKVTPICVPLLNRLYFVVPCLLVQYRRYVIMSFTEGLYCAEQSVHSQFCSR
jgi:hypothetical protein